MIFDKPETRSWGYDWNDFLNYGWGVPAMAPGDRSVEQLQWKFHKLSPQQSFFFLPRERRPETRLLT
jgi:hypothetical protein